MTRDTVIIHGTEKGYTVQCFTANNHPVTDSPIERTRNYEVITLSGLYLGRLLTREEREAINLMEKGDILCLRNY